LIAVYISRVKRLEAVNWRLEAGGEKEEGNNGK
jgi:hypothetical protein